MSKSDILHLADYLEHILEAIQRIHEYTDDISEHIFLTHKQTQHAVLYNIGK